MQRIPEPELMDDGRQAEAYANADFEAQHSRIAPLMKRLLNLTDIEGHLLDVGCGPGDVTFRLAKAFPGAFITAIDGAEVMIDLAAQRLSREAGFEQRINFIHARIPEDKLPVYAYQAIVSSSFLHHLHQPQMFWELLKTYGKTGCKIFVADLIRPQTIQDAQQMVKESASGEPLILQHDYYHSLLAAFTVEEVKEQLSKAGLHQLQVIEDGYLLVYGELS